MTVRLIVITNSLKVIIERIELIYSYDIEPVGPVQEINYASETECGHLRLVSEDELDSLRKAPYDQQPDTAKKPAERKPVPEERLVPEKKPVQKWKPSAPQEKPAKRRVKQPSPPRLLPRMHCSRLSERHLFLNVNCRVIYSRREFIVSLMLMNICILK